MSRTTSSDLKERHGSVHMLAEVLLHFVTVLTLTLTLTLTLILTLTLTLTLDPNPGP